jgi:prepilin signal peptidase PulO-like enzyme (type II secretory pathway)
MGRVNAMDFSLQQFGKWLILPGTVIALLGGLIMISGRIGLFKLPGDLVFGSRNWRVFLPIGSCIVISIVLTVVLWLINMLRRWRRGCSYETDISSITLFNLLIS